MNDFTLWGGHVQRNESGQSAFRGRGGIDYLKSIFEEAIVGWLPNADNAPSSAWGEIRLHDGVTIVSKAYWNGSKWSWVSTSK